MALKTLVKASEVNNLSDARYCAGMGVEMLGFCLDENHPKFIELARLREISVWFRA
jgi:phosphoribosylanthranilate isomerase